MAATSPACSARVRPKRIAMSAVVTRTAPATSGRLREPSSSAAARTSGRSTAAAAALASASGTMIANTQRQPSRPVIAPPSSSPAMTPSVAMAARTESARVRSAPAGKRLPISARPAGTASAEPRPWTARAAIRTPSAGAAAARSAPAANSAMPATSIRRRPYRSPSRPPSSSTPPNARPYAVSTHWPAIGAAPRSRWIVGSAIATERPSAPMRNCAAHAAAAPSRGRETGDRAWATADMRAGIPTAPLRIPRPTDERRCVFVLSYAVSCGNMTVTRELLGAERREVILRRLKPAGRGRGARRSDELGVSPDTARRAPAELAAAGALRRVHGGALPPASPGPSSFKERLPDDVASKAAIAAAAVGLVRPGEVVALSGGTTILELARRLPDDLEATVVATSPDIAVALADHPRLTVDVVGGRLHPQARTVTGPEAVDAVRAVRPDVCVLSACSLNPVAGMTLRHREEAAVVRAMVERSARVVSLVTAAKLGSAGAYPVAAVERIDTLVTDADDDDLAVYRERGIEVVRA